VDEGWGVFLLPTSSAMEKLLAFTASKTFGVE